MPDLEAAITRMEAAIEQQNANIENMVSQMVALVGTMTTFAAALTQRPTKRQAYMVVAVMLAVLGLVFWGLRDNHKVSEKIFSCTDPTGECARRGQKATEVALLQIKCGQVDLINELATKNNLVPVAVPDDCEIFKQSGG